MTIERETNRHLPAVGTRHSPDRRILQDLMSPLRLGLTAILPAALALTPGTRLGVYESPPRSVPAGMGEVYRARDTKLNRRRRDQDPARRRSPRDPDRLARFQREAEVARVAEPSEHRGDLRPGRSGGITALVMELVEGDDLSQTHRARSDSDRRGAADREADRRGARSRARARDHPSRSEAREHQGAPRRHREGAGLRLGESAGARRHAAIERRRSRRRSRRPR